MELSPSEIRYTQNSISDRFFDGAPLTETFAHLLAGDLTPDDLPPIECARKGGRWFAVSGNRRLLLYKKLERVGEINSISVVIGHELRNFTTSCDGKRVRCRCGTLNADLREIIYEYRRGVDIVAKWGGSEDQKSVTRSEIAMIVPQTRSESKKISFGRLWSRYFLGLGWVLLALALCVGVS